MQIYRASNVFVPGGMPQHTYVKRAADLEEKLGLVRDNLCKLVALTGPTKSGKTVLANRLFPRTNESFVWVDGGSIQSEGDVWDAIHDQAGAETSSEESKSNEVDASLETELGAEGGIPGFAKAKTSAKPKIGTRRGTTQRKIRQQPKKLFCMNYLRKADHALIIDDFHYISRSIQGTLVRSLKPLVFEGVPIILIAIPHRQYDVVRVEKEMTGRLETISVPSWNKAELLQISSTGFPLLNMSVPSTVQEKMAEEAFGSPHLMQEFCKSLASKHNVVKTTESEVRIKEFDDELFQQSAQGTGRVIFDKLAKGPRQRTDRKQRPLRNGNRADIYKVVLLALAELSPGMARVNYEDLRGSIRTILHDTPPQAHEISRVLEKMAQIAATDESSVAVLDWDKEEKQLHITDPFFAFFLKWGLQEER